MLISIIIPFYNSRDYIEACVLSCLDQSYRDFELIMVDDGSDDGSFDIVDKIAKKDSRIRLVSQENKGASAARNKGLDISRGDFIMFVDSDDWIEPDMLSSMIIFFDKYPEVQVVQTRVPRDFCQQKREGIYSADNSVMALLEGSWWGPYCKLIRKSAVDRIRFPDKTISEDYLFNYKLFSKISFLYYFDKCFYHREDVPGSLSKMCLSKRKFDEFYNVKYVYDSVVTEYPKYRQLAELHLAGTCLKLTFMLFHSKSQKEYSKEKRDLLNCVRSHYCSFIKNPFIPWKERVLICTSISQITMFLSERLLRCIHLIHR